MKTYVLKCPNCNGDLSVEDGLDTLRSSDLARVDNAEHFELKVFLSKKCNILFIR